MTNLIVCPKCQKGLRTTVATAAGKSITCPACGTTFVAGEGNAPAPAAARSKMGVIAWVSGGLALLAVLSVTAFVWPGFLVPSRPVSRAPALLAYVPAGCPIVAGAQVGLFRTDPQLHTVWADLQQKVAQLPDFPPEARDLLGDADEIVVAGPSDLDGPAVFVASTERPYDPEKVKRLARAGPPRVLAGHRVYPVSSLVPGRLGFLALPTDQVIVLGFLPQADFVELLTNSARNRLHPDLQEQIDLAGRGFAWLGVRFDDNIRRHMQRFDGTLAPLLVGLGSELPDLVTLTQRGKGALLSIDVGNQKLKLSLGVTCGNGADAVRFTKALDGFWNTQAKHWLALGKLFDRQVPGLSRVLGEVEQSFLVEHRSNSAIASVELNQSTLQDLASAVKNSDINPAAFLPVK